MCGRGWNAARSPQNLKTGAGGSYDIDYLAGLLQAKTSGLVRGQSAGACCERFASASCCPSSMPVSSVESARFLRTVEHLVRLVSGTGAQVAAGSRASAPVRCRSCCGSILGTNDSFDPEMRLAEIDAADA